MLPDDRSRPRRGLTLGTFGAYVVIAAALTWPLVPNITTAVPSDPGDPLLTTWILWWNAVTVPFTSAWWNAPAFYPTEGVLTLSEHLLGLTPISTPIYWLTGNIQLAHNVTLFLSFPLSAFFGYLLCRDLTGRRDAAFIGGLIFGFTPYRIVQLPHIQVLCSYWMPIALLGLHRYLRDERPRWLAVFAAGWVMQALANGYYMVFLSVLAGVWMLWFVPLARWRVWLKVGAVWAAAALPIVAIVLKYREVHAALGLRRDVNEMLLYSADLTSLIDHSMRLTFWNWLPAWHRAESELFPGVTAIVLIAGAVIVSRSAAARVTGWLRTTRLVLTILIVLSLVAVAISLASPVGFSLAGLRISITNPHKPLTLALVSAIVLIFTSPRMTLARSRRSVFTFYIAAAGLMWLFSLGPKPTFMGVQALHRGPYALLLGVPGMDALRTPARFHMVTVLCLSCAAAIAFARLVPPDRRSRGLVMAVGFSALAMVDTWIVGFPLVDRPERWPVEQHVTSDAVVVVPLGDLIGDTAAMYRSIERGHAVVNGYSGHRPPSYRSLELGLSRQDPELLDALPASGVNEIVLDAAAPGAGNWLTFLAGRPDIALVADDGRHRVYRLPPPSRAGQRELGAPLAIAAVSVTVAADIGPHLIDGDVTTWWETRRAQRGDEVIEIDLGRSQRIAGLVLSAGPRPNDIPQELSIDVSDDGHDWTPAWRGSSAGIGFRAALRDPVRMPLTFDIGDRDARFIRLRQLGREEMYHWSVAELQVLGPPKR